LTRSGAAPAASRPLAVTSWRGRRSRRDSRMARMCKDGSGLCGDACM
jgi:hypothetical protein